MLAHDAMTVLTIADALLAEITAFRHPELFFDFGLPEQLEPSTALVPAPEGAGAAYGLTLQRHECSARR
jgi:hypothetical protein